MRSYTTTILLAVASHLFQLTSSVMGFSFNNMSPLKRMSARKAVDSTPEEDPSALLRQCATERSVKAPSVISMLERLEEDPRNKIDPSLLDGQFELVFSSAVANLPIVGSLFGGYMPNKEIITFDLARGEMSLVVELLPFLPTIDIDGDNLLWDEKEMTLKYTVRGKEDKAPSRWTILYADDEIVAARSSVTGLNVIRRLH